MYFVLLYGDKIYVIKSVKFYQVTFVNDDYINILNGMFTYLPIRIRYDFLRVLHCQLYNNTYVWVLS